MFRSSTIAATFVALFAAGAICISTTSANANSVYFGIGHGYYGGADHGAGSNTKKSRQQSNSNQQQSSTVQTSKKKKKSKTK